MPTIGIYKITNLINTKSYIGQSVNIEKRWEKHKKLYLKENSHTYRYPLYSAFRKYGIENFSFEILEKCNKEELNNKEIYWINFFNTFFNGYNQTLGGNQTLKIPKENIIGIIKDLKETDLTVKEIAQKRNVSVDLVYDINSGTSWNQLIEYPIRKQYGRYYKNPNFILKNKKKCKLCGNQITIHSNGLCKNCYKKKQSKNIPQKEQLIQDLLKYPMIQIGKKYNVSDNAVRKWCKKYDLPYKQKDIIEFRNNYTKGDD